MPPRGCDSIPGPITTASLPASRGASSNGDIRQYRAFVLEDPQLQHVAREIRRNFVSLWDQRLHPIAALPDEKLRWLLSMQ